MQVLSGGQGRMQKTDTTQTQDLGETPLDGAKGSFMGAVRFWERGRLIYNLVLTGVVVFWLVATWPHFRPAMTLHSLLLLSILGLLANVCYCAAYIADIPLRSFSLSVERGRWEVWSLGTLFAFLVANYWIADEIYPFVN
jgi:hypothetical protein